MAQAILLKSRMRWAGRSYDSLDAVAEKVLELFNQGHTSPSELAEIGQCERKKVYRLMERLIEQGKLARDPDTGSIVKTSQVAARSEWLKLERDSWINAYPSVRKWVDSLSTRKGGRPLAKMGTLITSLKTVCDTLKVTPDVFATDRQTVEEYVKNFSIEYAKKSPARIKNYVMAIRNFALTNGVVIPRGANGILSGKKHNFGVYASTFLTDAQISEGLKVGESISQEVALLFGLGHEVFARATPLIDIRTDQVRYSQFNGFDYGTLTIFESKTQKPFEKLIIDPRVLRLLRSVTASHRGALFTEGRHDFHNGQQGYFAEKMRQIYSAVGIDVKSEGENGLINYYKDKPLHALRHSGAHLWHRRGAKIEEISAMGWDDPATLVKCYMRTSIHEMFSRGTCMKCNPPKSQTENLLFCSLPHAMEWLNERFGVAA